MRQLAGVGELGALLYVRSSHVVCGRVAISTCVETSAIEEVVVWMNCSAK